MYVVYNHCWIVNIVWKTIHCAGLHSEILAYKISCHSLRSWKFVFWVQALAGYIPHPKQRTGKKLEARHRRSMNALTTKGWTDQCWIWSFPSLVPRVAFGIKHHRCAKFVDLRVLCVVYWHHIRLCLGIRVHIFQTVVSHCHLNSPMCEGAWCSSTS